MIIIYIFLDNILFLINFLQIIIRNRKLRAKKMCIINYHIRKYCYKIFASIS